MKYSIDDSNKAFVVDLVLPSLDFVRNLISALLIEPWKASK